MDSAQDGADLTGKLLVAMPGMGDPRFEKSVIYLCTHSEEGAMGLIVNKPAADLSFPDLLNQLEIAAGPKISPANVYFGGPVDHGRGFVLHSADYTDNDSTLAVDTTFAMTATLDILQDMAQGQGPARAILALGYSGWGAGQLDREITENGWLTCDATAELVFGAEDDTKWTGALATLGIDAMSLSAAAGRA